MAGDRPQVSAEHLANHRRDGTECILELAAAEPELEPAHVFELGAVIDLVLDAGAVIARKISEHHATCEACRRIREGRGRRVIARRHVVIEDCGLERELFDALIDYLETRRG